MRRFFFHIYFFDIMQSTISLTQNKKYSSTIIITTSQQPNNSILAIIFSMQIFIEEYVSIKNTKTNEIFIRNIFKLMLEDNFNTFMAVEEYKILILLTIFSCILLKKNCIANIPQYMNTAEIK
jgi:hypothetical protein